VSELTDDDKAILAELLRETIERDRYPLSQRIKSLVADPRETGATCAASRTIATTEAVLSRCGCRRSTGDQVRPLGTHHEQLRKDRCYGEFRATTSWKVSPRPSTSLTTRYRKRPSGEWSRAGKRTKFGGERRVIAGSTASQII
jgi:hypothetical protein